MATSFTRLDVEDVLSSIRKLVSDTTSGSGGGSSVPPLLLLTPAHRVVEDTSRMTLSMPAAENERGDTAEVGTLHGETGDLGPLNLGTPVFVRAKDDAPAAPLNVDDETAEDARHEEPAPLIIGLGHGDLPDAEAAEDQPAEAVEVMESPDAVEPDPEVDPFADAAGHSGSLEMRAAEFEIALSQEEEEWEPDGSEAEPQGFPELAFLAKYREKAAEAARQTEVPEEGAVPDFVTEAIGQASNVPAQDEALAEPAQADDMSADDASTDIEELLEAVSDDNADLEEERESAEAAPELSDAEAIDHILRMPAVEDEDHDQQGVDQDDADEPQLEPAELAEIVSSFAEPESDEAPVAAAQDDNALALDDDEETIGEAVVTKLADARPHEAHPTPLVIEFEDDDEGFDEPEVWSSDDELLVDEEVLRRVVADIVKDELQGRLGERITRNVRKMVRREIEKALSTKHLE